MKYLGLFIFLTLSSFANEIPFLKLVGNCGLHITTIQPNPNPAVAPVFSDEKGTYLLTGSKIVVKKKWNFGRDDIYSLRPCSDEDVIGLSEVSSAALCWDEGKYSNYIYKDKQTGKLFITESELSNTFLPLECEKFDLPQQQFKKP